MKKLLILLCPLCFISALMYLIFCLIGHSYNIPDWSISLKWTFVLVGVFVDTLIGVWLFNFMDEFENL
jgi:hypothetical protein